MLVTIHTGPMLPANLGPTPAPTVLGCPASRGSGCPYCVWLSSMRVGPRLRVQLSSKDNTRASTPAGGPLA